MPKLNYVYLLIALVGLGFAWPGVTQAINKVSLSNEQIQKFSGEKSLDLAGSSAASAGDVNNDGYDDFLIGAARQKDNQGTIYLLYGKPSLTNKALSSNTIVKFTGDIDFNSGMLAVASAGDINGDDYDDIIIGSNYDSNSIDGSSRGAAFLIYGQSKKLPDMMLDAASTVKFTGATNHDGAGNAVAGAGDVNSDGYDDMLIGTDEGTSGKAYLIYGKKTKFEDTTLDDSNIVQFQGEANGDDLGYAVAFAGDINNDGYEDILLGARGYGPDRKENSEYAEPSAGAAYLIYGQKTKLPGGIVSAETASKFSGESNEASAGRRVASAGDVNGDGYDDFMVTQKGKVNLIYGQSTQLKDNVLNANKIVQFVDYSGYDQITIASAGDVNKDGYNDLLIGNSKASRSKGATYMIYGKNKKYKDGALKEVSAIKFIGESNNGLTFGNAISSAGDVNNDGYDDILIGATGYDNNAGVVYFVQAQIF